MHSASMMGVSEGTDINIIFRNMETLIDKMKEQIDKDQKS
jgi:hypothetical protein